MDNNRPIVFNHPFRVVEDGSFLEIADANGATVIRVRDGSVSVEELTLMAKGFEMDQLLSRISTEFLFEGLGDPLDQNHLDVVNEVVAFVNEGINDGK